jgi:uncharacterized protein (TIGR03437 family)
MPAFRPLLVGFLSVFPALCATFGTPVQHPSPLVDLTYDQARKRLYVLSPLSNTLEIYDTTAKTPTLLARGGTIAVDANPIALAMSRSGRYLWVACYQAGVIDQIDLQTLAKVNTISLPANPEAVAVGYDERLLISTIGTPQGQFVLTIYDPNSSSITSAVQSITVAPPAPGIPTVPPPNGLPKLAVRAHLAATPDGQTIIGVHEPGTANTRTVFVYQVSSATMLRSRSVAIATPVLAVSADGSRFLSGHLLFDTATLSVLGQQNATNSPFVFSPGANFTTMANQGGAAFLPDGSELLAAYNIVPLQNPAAQSNFSQLLVNTPDNLLIQLGIQLPQNLAGKMVITPDGSTIYALSTSGFLVLPVSTLKPGTTSSPIAIPDSNVALLAADQCGVLGAQGTATIPVRNVGGGRITLSAQVLATTSTSATLRTASKTYGGDVTAVFNSTVSRTTLGTASPDQLLLQAPEAVNVIPMVRVFQNNRNSETPGTIIPVDIGATTTAGLTDIVEDTARQRLYIANPGLNRIEVFDMQQKAFLSPINVGQLPKSMAFGNDGNSLYVANSGGENLSLVHLNTDLTKVTVETINFPPLPFATGIGLLTPSLVASSQRDPQVIMSDGSMWKIVGNTVTLRKLNPNIFGTANTIPGPQTMVSTPEGSYILVLAGQGSAFLYSAAADDIIAGRQVISTPTTGYFGAVSAGPNGQYYLAGPQILDSSLTLVGTEPGAGGPISIGGLPLPGGPTTLARPVAAVAAVGAQTFARFTAPIRTSLTTPATDAGIVELVDATSQKTVAQVNTPEGPLNTATLAGRATNVNGRQMVVDAASNTAYLITATGLTIITLPTAAVAAPTLTPGGIVNTANFQSKVAAGGLIAIFGRNLASTASAPGTPLPTILGGTCVTLNNTPLPLMAASSGQINAQLPPTLTAGNYQVVVRSLTAQAASSTSTIPVARYAPAIFVDQNGPAIFHADGTRVDKNHPATRDEHLTIYATGLGPTTGGRVTAGLPAPSSPLAVTGPVNLWFGDPTRSDTPVIVDWSGLAPGLIGVYQIDARIPGVHYKGDAIPVTLKVGGVSSPTTGVNVPVVYVN